MMILIYNNLNNNSQCYQTDGPITAGGGEGGGEGGEIISRVLQYTNCYQCKCIVCLPHI